MRAALVRAQCYSHAAIAFHWVIAALIVANLALGLLHDSLLDGLGWVTPLHKSFGLTVIALTLGRIGWRVAYRPPPLPPSMKLWERGAAQTMHILLYGFMLALPITGWMLASGSHKHPTRWFGLFQVPFLPVSEATADQAYSAHVALAWTLIGLLVIHVAAALRHHLLLRDGVLARMIPAFLRRA